MARRHGCVRYYSPFLDCCSPRYRLALRRVSAKPRLVMKSDHRQDGWCWKFFKPIQESEEPINSYMFGFFPMAWLNITRRGYKTSENNVHHKDRFPKRIWMR